MENLYKTFGIQDFATDEELKKAFREMAKKYHPDNVETGDIEKFRELEEKYRTLSIPESRREYDSKLRVEQSMEDLYNKSSKIFHFNDSDDEERVRAKEAQFQDENYNESRNSGSYYYENFLKNMTGFAFNTYEQKELKDQIDKLRYNIYKRKEFVHSESRVNNPYEKMVEESRISFSKLRIQLDSIEKQEVQKVNEMIDLHNRKMYQIAPQRFESVENILKQELKELRIQKEKLKIHLDVAECKRDSLDKSYFSYKEEALDNDIELIRLRVQLRKLEHQLNNPNYLEVSELYDKVFNLECSIAKRKSELRQYINTNNSYPDKMTEIGEKLAELVVEKNEIDSKISEKNRDLNNLRNDMVMRFAKPKKLENEANKMLAELQMLDSRQKEISSQRSEAQTEYNGYRGKYITNEYIVEYLENDAQLIQLRSQLENVEQQIESLNIHHQRR